MFKSIINSGTLFALKVRNDLVSIPRNLKGERGQGLVEYALILVLISVVVIAIMILLGTRIGYVFTYVTCVLKVGMGQAHMETIGGEEVCFTP